MSQSWALEFVGGPLDGRRDIVTPVSCDRWHVHSTWAQPVEITNKPQELVACPEIHIHVYRRGRMLKRAHHFAGGQKVINEIMWEVWMYDATT